MLQSGTCHACQIRLRPAEGPPAITPASTPATRAARQLVQRLAADGWLASHPANGGEPTEHDSPVQTIVVLSASKEARWSPSPDTAVISIRGTRDAVLPLSPKYRAILRLVFDDTSRLAEPSPEAVPLTAAQAVAVAAFVAAHASTNTLLLHCQAGGPRSRSMAAAICTVRVSTSTGWCVPR